MKKMKLISALIILFITTDLSTQQLTPDNLLDNMVGKWLLKGTIENKETNG